MALSPSLPVAVVGGGLVGLATAWTLLESRPGLPLILLEKETEPGLHQSTRNSGVLHAGLYYKPGSLKARLAVEGIRLMRDFAVHHRIPHEICGKLVLATDPSSKEILRSLHERGRANGLAGLAWLEPEQIREIEPHAAGLAALRVPEEGIIDYRAVCHTLATLITAAGGRILTSTPFLSARPEGGGWQITTSTGPLAASFLINCAGLHCDRVARRSGSRPVNRIIPFRGEYHKLKPTSQHLCRHLIYPVAHPAFPFLGVHFTRLIHGGVECGPNAVPAFAREGYHLLDISWPDLAGFASFPGFWKFFTRHPRMCLDELRTSCSRTHFCRRLQQLIPAVTPDDLEPGGSGVRAQAMSPQGTLIADFDLVETDRALHVLNAPSPAATASLAIARHIVSRLSDKKIT